MRIIVWSDLHSEEHEDFSFQLDNGLNSRLADCLNVIDKVTYYFKKYDCDLTLFCGDLFHTPQVLTTTVFQETYKHLEKLADVAARKQGMVMLAGNHDMASITRDGEPVSTVYAIGRLPKAHVIVGKYEPYLVADHNVMIHCVPYFKDKNLLDSSINRIRDHEIKTKHTHIIATHIGLDQPVNGPNEIRLNGYAVSKLRGLGAQKIFSGHHHHPEDHGSWTVIGAPLQMNMLDRGDKRGILIYDTKTNKTKRIWLGGSRFFLREIKGMSDFDSMKLAVDGERFKGGYVRVNLTQGIVSYDQVEDLLSKACRMYKIIPVSTQKTTMRSELVTQKALANIGNLSAVVPDYVAHTRTAGLKPKRLIRIGRKLINES